MYFSGTSGTNGPMSRFLIRIGIVIVCAVSAVSCDDPIDDELVGELKEFELLTHPEAINVERHRFPEVRLWQVNYEVKVTYPKIAVDTHQKSTLIEMGWTECKDISVTWQIFLEEVSDTRSRCVYQEVSRLRKANMLLSIRHYYGDQIVENYECPRTPTNPFQTVIVSIHSYDDVDAVVDLLGLTCER